MKSKEARATFQYNIGDGEKRITVGARCEQGKTQVEWKDSLLIDAINAVSDSNNVEHQKIVIALVDYNEDVKSGVVNVTKLSSLERKFINWIKRSFLCPIGLHSDKLLNGQPANFCGHCGKQLNPNAYSDYEVHLRSGEIREVKAVNTHHALSMVIYGGNLTMDEKGNPLGSWKIHPDNIVDVLLKR